MWRPLTGILCLSLSAALAQPRVELLAPFGHFATDPSRLTAADVDGDGLTDLVVLPAGSIPNDADPHAYALRNLGGRTFSAPALIHLAPLGKDQRLTDARALDVLPSPGTEIFANRWTGATAEAVIMTPSFTGFPPSAATVIGGQSELAWSMSDLDGDGIPELVDRGIAPDGYPFMRIHVRNAAGSFLPTAEVAIGFLRPDNLTLEATDVDGDGDLDLYATGGGWGEILERTGTWDFTSRQLIEAQASTLADIDGDGLPDLLVGDRWRRNEGGFTFGAETILALGVGAGPSDRVVQVEERPGSAAVLHIVSLSAPGALVYEAIPADGGGPVVSWQIPIDTDHLPALLMDDLDRDGRLDVIFTSQKATATNDTRARLHVAWGGPAGFTVTGPWSDASTAPVDFITGDFNADRGTDLILGPLADGHYRLRFNRGAAGLGEEISLDGLHIPGTTVRILGAQRIDKDRHLDLVCCYTAEESTWRDPQTALVVVRGRGDGSFIRPGLTKENLRWTSSPVVGGDFVDWDRDGDLDLVAFGIWRENRGGTFTADERFLIGLGQGTDFLGNPATIGGTVTGDLDGDRAPDIISLVYGALTYDPFGHGEGPGMLVGYNDGFGGIRETVELPYSVATYDFLGNPTIVGGAAIADLNLDKKPDLWLSVANGSDMLGNPVSRSFWLRNPGKKSRDPATWVELPLPDHVPPGSPLGNYDGNRTSEWISLTGYLRPAKGVPAVSPEYNPAAPLDFSTMNTAAIGDFDADGDSDFILGGWQSPALLLWNPAGDTRKRNPFFRNPKPKPLRWAGLPAVR